MSEDDVETVVGQRLSKEIKHKGESSQALVENKHGLHNEPVCTDMCVCVGLLLLLFCCTFFLEEITDLDLLWSFWYVSTHTLKYVWDSIGLS